MLNDIRLKYEKRREYNLKQKAYLKLAIYSLAHFAVDMCCAYIMLSAAKTAENFLIYNFFAFAMQMPIGVAADAINKNSLFAGVGIFFVSAAFLFSSPLAAAVAAGTGNAMFHIGGGTEVLYESEKTSRLGVFVAPGALGLFLGALLSKTKGVGVILAVSLIFLGILFFIPGLLCEKSFKTANGELSLKTDKNGIICVLCAFIVVLLRSFTGFMSVFSWKTGVYSVLAVLALALGKAAGGFVCDRIGKGALTAISLGLSGVLFLFSNVPAIGLTAVFLFNMSMPVTLDLAAKSFKGARGFSFGLMTFALFLGFLPTYFGYSAKDNGALLCALCAVSCAFMFLSVREEKKIAF